MVSDITHGTPHIILLSDMVMEMAMGTDMEMDLGMAMEMGITMITMETA